MKKLLLFTLFLIVFCGKCWAQGNGGKDPEAEIADSRNIVYAEILGNSLAGISANYSRLFPLKTTLPVTIALRAGIGKVITFNIDKGSDESLVSYPVEISVFAGRNTLKPEVGVGLTVIDDVGNYPLGAPQSKTKKLLLTSLGFRLHKPDSRFFMRGGLTFGLMDLSAGSPDFSRSFKGALPGISVGLRF